MQCESLVNKAPYTWQANGATRITQHFRIQRGMHSAAYKWQQCERLKVELKMKGEKF